MLREIKGLKCSFKKKHMHFPRIGRHFEFGGHFGSNINYYKSETFLMPNKTFVDIFIGVLQEMFLY